MRPKSWTAALLLASVSWAGLSVAQDSSESLVAERTRGDVAWRTGGVGHDERARLEQVSSDYNLKLVFAEKDTLAFVADVEVRITRPGGGESLLEAEAEGPWMLVRLPGGAYEVTATANGAPQTQTANVPGSGQAELRFYWAAPSK